MTISQAKVLGAGTLLSLSFLAFRGCHTSDTAPSDVARGGGGSTADDGPSDGSGGNAGAGRGGSGGAAGQAGASAHDGSTDAPAACEDPTWFTCNPDDNCTTSNAKSDATCTVDCTIPCGFEQLGTKACSCVGGVYAQCPCPRPATYLGEGTAKYCDDPHFPSATDTGLMQEMKGLPCDTEWEQCVARDVPPGSTPRGCVCMSNGLSGRLRWVCGSTNKWFFPE